MSIKIETDKCLRERIAYADDGFTFAMFTDDYSKFYKRTLNCHWHYDFEFSYVLSGTVDYFINDTYIEAAEGECIFVNSNMLHMGKQPKNCNRTEMFTVTFPVSLLAADSSNIYAKYFQPVLSSRIEGFKASREDASGDEIRACLLEISALGASCFAYELECHSLAGRLWIATLRYIEGNESALLWHTGSSHHAERMKEILSFVHDNFVKRITVDDIAQYVNISRSECFRCFKRFMNKRPVEYINEYRLQKAAKLLRETEQSITDIYLGCGFDNASYFSKAFKDRYMATPIQYRKSAKQ